MLPTVCHSKIYILPQNARTVHETFNYRDIVFVGVDVTRGDGAAFTETTATSIRLFKCHKHAHKINNFPFVVARAYAMM